MPAEGQDEPTSSAEASTSDGGFSSVRPPPRPRRRLVAVTGAKGGVGKTLFASNLALYLATLGRKVVVLDLDPVGPNLHTLLGMEPSEGLAPYVPPRPSFTRLDAVDEAPAELDPAVALVDAPELPTIPDGPIDTPVPGLQLFSSGGRAARLSDWLERARSLEVDYVVVDLGAGVDRALVDFWLEADVRVFVTAPEPTAIENTYRFARVAFVRHLLRSLDDDASRRRMMLEMRPLGSAPAPIDLARWLEAEGKPIASRVRAEVEEFVFPVVVNQTRLRADLDLGDRMRTVALRRLGIYFDYLGYVDHDDTVFSCVRTRRPLLVESPGTKASKSLEKIARRLLAADGGKTRGRPLRTVPVGSYHDLLEVERGATDEEVRRAYKRAKEVYATDSLARYGLFDENGLASVRAQLDEAFDVLLDSARRRPYELSVFPPDPEPEPRPTAQDETEPKPPAPVITPDTEFSGDLLRAVRESQGVDLREVSQATKIGIGYLRAIEDEQFDALPAAVYVRGFVAELAKSLKLDPEQVSRSYLRRFRRHAEPREGT